MMLAKKIFKELYANYYHAKSVPEQEKNTSYKLASQIRESETRKKIQAIQDRLNNK